MASGNPNTDSGTSPKSSTGLLPLNTFGGHAPEVGGVCKFRVVQIYHDQVEVEYVEHEDDGGESPESAGVPPQESEGEMSQYLQ